MKAPRLHRSIGRSATLLALLTACGVADGAAPAASAPPSLAPPSLAPPSTEPTATAPAQPPATTGAADHASPPPSRSIEDARREAREEHFAAALAIAEALVAATPADARLRCEAGFFAYRAGDLARAEALLARGVLDLARDPATHEGGELRNPLAICHYNRGLVQEAAGNLDGARASLTASLELRPNTTVRRHLEQLGEAAPARAAAVDRRDPTPLPAQTFAGSSVAAIVGANADAICRTAFDQFRYWQGWEHGEMTRCATTIESERAGEGPHVSWLTFRPVVRGEGGIEGEGAGLQFVALDVAPNQSIAIGPVLSEDSLLRFAQLGYQLRLLHWAATPAGPALFVEATQYGSATADTCSDGWQGQEVAVVMQLGGRWQLGRLGLGELQFSRCEQSGEPDETPRRVEPLVFLLEPPTSGALSVPRGASALEIPLEAIVQRCATRCDVHDWPGL